MAFYSRISTEDGSLGHKGLIMEPFSAYLEQIMLSAETEIALFACGPLPLMLEGSRSQSAIPPELSGLSGAKNGLRGRCLSWVCGRTA